MSIINKLIEIEDAPGLVDLTFMNPPADKRLQDAMNEIEKSTDSNESSSPEKPHSASDADEIKRDLEISNEITQGLLERVKQPVNLDEKFISYDAMPKSLQRLIDAYNDLIKAKKEFDDSVQCLKSEL